MNFNNYNYIRPNHKELFEKVSSLIEEFKKADSADAQETIINQVTALRNDFDHYASFAAIKHTIDTRDEFYEKEQAYFDEVSPDYSNLINEYYKVVVDSKYRKELEAKYGIHFFNILETSLVTIRPEILDELKEENKLTTEYKKLMSSAKIEFRGKIYNTTSIHPFELDTDRTTRKEAMEAKYGFYAENQDKLDEIYDKLVKLRHSMAQKLGYENYIELGYKKMLRTDYDAKDVSKFRDMVHKYIVPLATKLRKRQALRLGVKDMKTYDEGLNFLTGNAKPKGEPAWIVEQATTMYKELNEETNEFFQYMLKNDLMDLVVKDGKAPGGYCTYLANNKSPFIYSNFNGTSHDVDVLTHEAGHAFQVYKSRDAIVPEYLWPTFEACEIHSMSMEFFAWPWMNKFFKEDEQKYKFSHLSGSILFLPYGVAVDEFQHFVYENPNCTPEERRAAWRKLELKYLPHRDYGGFEYLENGGFWQRQGHIYEMPFYYIDYTLAQVCAFQFWKRANDNQEEALADYVKLCKKGGSLPFTELVKYANLESPFEEKCFLNIISEIENWLNAVDDTQLN